MLQTDRFVVLLTLILLSLSPLSSGQGLSKLWGAAGENWTAASRLPDFSHAGYRSGEAVLPDPPVVANVLDFGAEADGKTDCSAAFRKAIAAAGKGAILVPEGRYVLGSVIEITRSDVVLRGAGPGKTVLVIPKSLQQLAPVEASSGGKKLRYSFSGGFIHLRGKTGGKLVSRVGSPAKRGDRRLVLGNTEGIEAGSWLRLLMNNDPSLGAYLHAGQPAGKATFVEKKNFVDWVVQVVKVENGAIEIDRPLRVDVREEWQPEIHSFEPSLREVGIEDLSFEFPGTPKQKHLLEEGFNAIYIERAVNCWVRNVEVIDADNGVNIRGARFCSFEGIVGRARQREGLTGHHFLWASGNSQDCLFSDFLLETTYVHDLTVEGFAQGNVFKNGRGLAINLDHHRNCPYENLFSNIDVGDPRRLFASSGRGDRGPHAGVRATFWNLHWRKGKPPRVPDWPVINYIGATSSPVENARDGLWIESPDAPLHPSDLHAAQVKRRLRLQEQK